MYKITDLMNFWKHFKQTHFYTLPKTQAITKYLDDGYNLLRWAGFLGFHGNNRTNGKAFWEWLTELLIENKFDVHLYRSGSTLHGLRVAQSCRLLFAIWGVIIISASVKYTKYITFSIRRTSIKSLLQNLHVRFALLVHLHIHRANAR